MDDSRLEAISRTLDVIAQKFDLALRLGVVAMTQGKTQSEQIWLLSLAGFQPREIAEFIDTTPNAVRVALFNLRRLRKPRRGSRKPK